MTVEDDLARQLAQIERMARQLSERPPTAEQLRAAALRDAGEQLVADVIREHDAGQRLLEAWRNTDEPSLRVWAATDVEPLRSSALAELARRGLS